MDRYDLIVIGAGSGGLAAARRAAALGKRTVIIEAGKLGGTCVNRGCVPKKLWHDTAGLIEAMHDARAMGFDIEPPKAPWSALRRSVDDYIVMLNGVYARNLERDGVELVEGRGRLTGPTTVQVGDRTLQADVIVVATGTRPRALGISGHDLTLTSDDFFKLEGPPARTLVMGGGYIGVEFAGILAAFGSQVTIVEFFDRLLLPFDPEVAEAVRELYAALGIHVILGASVEAVENAGDARRVSVKRKDGTTEELEADAVISAVGRVPNVEELGLGEVGVELDARGFIAVDGGEQTSVRSIYAIGDVTGRPALTPVAIKAGRKLADRLFDGATSRMRYDMIATAVFTPVELGMVGMTESQARDAFGDAVKVYRSRFKPMRKALVKDTPVRALVKLVVAGPEERVLGLHLMCPEASEIIQGFAVAVTAGLTKEQFDDTIAIHPSIAEEVVTLR